MSTQAAIDATAPAIPPIRIGSFTLRSRLVVGTGKYRDYPTMQAAIEASGADCVTVAVRRERLVDAQGRSILDFLPLDRLTILPNTAGCFTAEDAVRVSRLGREILEQLGNPGAGWVKLEVLGDKTTLLPDPVGTLEACKELVKDGFTVLCYSSDDPIIAARLRDAAQRSQRLGFHVGIGDRRRTGRQQRVEQPELRGTIGRHRAVIVEMVARQIAEAGRHQRHAVQPPLLDAVRRGLHRHLPDAGPRQRRPARQQPCQRLP